MITDRPPGKQENDEEIKLEHPLEALVTAHREQISEKQQGRTCFSHKHLVVLSDKGSLFFCFPTQALKSINGVLDPYWLTDVWILIYVAFMVAIL